MILYFADRQLNIIGQASTKLPKGFTIVDDEKTDEVETGVSIFECTIPFTDETRSKVEECASMGNHVVLKADDEDKLYTIIESETDTKKQEVYIYAEDDGMDLLNEVVGPYEADQAYNIAHYINKYAADAGFVIGINEVSGLTRKLSWDGESTATARIASVATQFDGCEVSYSFEIDGLNVAKKYINIYKERGKDIGVTLRLNQDIDRIITTKSIANLATALQCTGGTPEDTDLEDDVEPVPVTLKGYSYDDGDFYVDSNGVLKSRKALEKWNRLTWKTDDASFSGGHIVKQYSYDTTSQKELCSHAITELKKICDIEVNYEADVSKFPDSVKIGDRINIVDDHGELYLSTRVLKLQVSEINQEKKATFGEFLIKGSGISQKVTDLAAQFAKMAVSASRALAIARNAKKRADAAQKQADAALVDAENAKEAADEAQTAANAAAESAENAQKAADEAQKQVDSVEENVSSMEESIANAEKAIELAQQAAETADQKAVEAQQAAENAQAKAEETVTALEETKEKAETAISQAETAQSTAEIAIADAEEAATVAAAARLDAEQAQKDIDSLGKNLTTLENTMAVDFARKTDLTESEAKLQTQISQNAADIRSTATRFQIIDETANNAAELAAKAQAEAQAAQEEADLATEQAEAAQAAADEAAAAAQAAQAEADTAQAAADTANSLADEAEAALDAARADLATLEARGDATEAEIAAAEKAVADAQATAETAISEAEAAVAVAQESQTVANEAVASAEAAQAEADKAHEDAVLAQKLADEANGAAVAADVAMSAAVVAGIAQSTADTARANADTAQAQADEAAQKAQDALATAEAAAAQMEQAEADLAEAEQRLADVLANVDATQEEVDAAYAYVEVARKSADEATVAAEAAQAEADKANANAEAARITATEATAAADAAQAAAETATKAAAQAKEDVDKLAVRMTNAETEIKQNAEEISLRATKEEVVETLGGYSTKEETEAKLQVMSDSITQTVTKTYATKQEVEDVDSTRKENDEAIRNEIVEQGTSIISECENIILTALESYVQTGDYDEFRSTVSAQLEIMSDEISMNFTTTTEQITSVDGDMQSKFTELYKYISFSDDGITIGGNETGITLTLDNDGIVFSKNGKAFGRWDGNDFYTGNVVVQVNERAQFGNFAFVPRSDGSLMFLKVAGYAAESAIAGVAVAGVAVVGKDG